MTNNIAGKKTMRNKGIPIIWISFCLVIVSVVQAQSDTLTYTNPILPGSYPDPSICRSGDTYYLVNSSFEYFPGLPIHKSTDLVNWELIGYGLHREEQANGIVNLVDVNSNGGIHAPSIRYQNGLFYIITTNVYYHEEENTTDFVNFIITAEDPAGPWSDPHVLEGAPGIDPDIFFDDDGSIWYVGTHSPENPSFPGEGEIWLQEIDADNWSLKGERHFLWRGACGGVWAEGPHLYKRNGWYYLMIAEGGTSFNHAVMIAISDSITGPYIPNDRNPILTSRHLSYDNWVHSVGHADLFELADGRWYMVALGIRGDEERGSNMGRETHLLPVEWETEPFEWKDRRYDWPVVAPQTGKPERTFSSPLGTPSQPNSVFVDDFDTEELGPEWNFRRVPLQESYSMQDNRGHLRLYNIPDTIRERGRASLLGFRQTESDFMYKSKMRFNPKRNESEAGICIIQKDNNYISYTVVKKSSKYVLRLKVQVPDSDPRKTEQALPPEYDGDITLQVVAKEHTYSYYYALNGEDLIAFTQTPANLILSKGYTGTYLSLYATGNGLPNKDYADFDWVKYTPMPKTTR